MPTTDEQAALDLIRLARDAVAALPADTAGDQTRSVEALRAAESALWALIGRRAVEPEVDVAAVVEEIAADPSRAEAVLIEAGMLPADDRPEERAAAP